MKKTSRHLESPQSGGDHGGCFRTYFPSFARYGELKLGYYVDELCRQVEPLSLIDSNDRIDLKEIASEVCVGRHFFEIVPR